MFNSMFISKMFSFQCKTSKLMMLVEQSRKPIIDKNIKINRCEYHYIKIQTNKQNSVFNCLYNLLLHLGQRNEKWLLAHRGVSRPSWWCCRLPRQSQSTDSLVTFSSLLPPSWTPAGVFASPMTPASLPDLPCPLWEAQDVTIAII